jgi:hypothetical protein
MSAFLCLQNSLTAADKQCELRDDQERYCVLFLRFAEALQQNLKQAVMRLTER